MSPVEPSWSRTAPTSGSWLQQAHSEPIPLGPVPILRCDPKLRQDLLCRGIPFGPAPEGCQEMSSALVWHCPWSPVPWQGGLGLGAEPTTSPLLLLLVPELWAQRGITLLVGTSRLPPRNPEALGRSSSLSRHHRHYWASPPSLIPLGVRAPG